MVEKKLGLKGQRAISPGQSPGLYGTRVTTPYRGNGRSSEGHHACTFGRVVTDEGEAKSMTSTTERAFALTARNTPEHAKPRAVPWADGSLALQAALLATFVLPLPFFPRFAL